MIFIHSESFLDSIFKAVVQWVMVRFLIVRLSGYLKGFELIPGYWVRKLKFIRLNLKDWMHFDRLSEPVSGWINLKRMILTWLKHAT